MALAQRLVALLETGQRQSTYKLATLMALIDACVENFPAADSTLAVPIQEIAHRVIAYYWNQSRPYDERGLLSQNKNGGRSIPDLIAPVRNTLMGQRVRTAEAAREAEAPEYLRLARKVERIVAQLPLTHLQTVPARGSGVGRQDFIFDASRLHKKMTLAELDAHGPIVLHAGVAKALRELAPLLKPMLEMLWATDVANMNRSHLETDDIAGFLFGSDRTALTSLTPHLRDLQDNRCFYCDRTVQTAHVDHVLPWSRIPIDGVANLVLTDDRCNLSKLASLPVPEHLSRALSRPALDLAEVSKMTRFPVLLDRTQRASLGLYGTIAPGSPLWQAPNRYVPHREPGRRSFSF
ncbi:HNH endonuclease [Prescottella agglutinans]|uniref:HNH endonuclease n=2 Tax=Prescottella agglutinans TaxID=1644129 RepID=A0A3S3AM52_9NOCA|nr:HNH endonuclease [Prescottella agglutinans]